MNDPDGRVIVVGGGLGGLLAAVELTRRGREVLVLEAEEQPGGVARTISEDGWLVDPAASSLILPHPKLSPILDAAGVPTTPAPPSARRRYVFDKGRLVELKESPAMVLSPLLSWRGKFRAAAEPFVRPSLDESDETLAAFLTRRFGAEAGRLVSTIVAHGVFAGDPDRLSVRACFSAMAELEDEAGSVVKGGLRRLRSRPKGAPRPSTHVMDGGMSGLAQALTRHLGSGLRSGWRVESLEREGGGWLVRGSAGTESAAQVVLAVPPHAAAALLPAAVTGLLADLRAAPVAVVAMGGRASDVPIPEGFGVLAGPDCGVRALGVLFDSSYAPGRAPAGCRLAKAIYGGDADPAVMDLDDVELLALAEHELGRVLGVPVQPSWTRVVRHHPGIPQYGVGHLQLMEAVDTALAAMPGVALAGWGYRGIGLTGLAADAVRLGDQLSRSS